MTSHRSGLFVLADGLCERYRLRLRRRAGVFWCDLRAGHDRIANYFLQAWGGLDKGLPGLQETARREIDSGYGLRHLAAHLEGAGRSDDLHHLLRLEWLVGWHGDIRLNDLAYVNGEARLLGQEKVEELWINRWYVAKEATGDTGSYLADVARAWRLAETLTPPPSPQPLSHKGRGATPLPLDGGGDGGGGEGIGLQICYALLTASLNSLAGNILPELLVALVKERVWTPAHKRDPSTLPMVRSGIFLAALSPLQKVVLPLGTTVPQRPQSTRRVGNEELRALRVLSG